MGSATDMSGSHHNDIVHKGSDMGVTVHPPHTHTHESVPVCVVHAMAR